MQPRRSIITSVLILATLAILVWLAIPHVWVRDRSVQMVYGGKISQDVTLYHGSDGREAIRIPDRTNNGELIYVYDPKFSSEYGMAACHPDQFVSLKFLLLAQDSYNKCVGLTKIDAERVLIVTPTSLEFRAAGNIPVKITWQNYSQPPQLIR